MTEHEQSYGALFWDSVDAMLVASPEGKLMAANQAASELFGLSSADILARSTAELVDGKSADFNSFVAHRPDKVRERAELILIRGDGSRFVADVSWVLSELADGKSAVLIVIRDITVQQKAEADLLECGMRDRSLLESLTEGVIVQASSGKILVMNDAAQGVFGANARQLMDRDPGDARWVPLKEDGSAFAREDLPFERVLASGQPLDNLLMHVVRQDGARRWISLNARAILEAGEAAPPAVLTTFRDYTEQRRQDAALHRVTRTLMALNAATKAVSSATSELDLLAEICRVCVEIAGYSLAGVGFMEDAAGEKIVRFVAAAGEHVEYLQRAKIRWDGSPWGNGPTGAAARTGEIQVNQDVRTSPRMAPWREMMTAYGFAASAAFPLMAHGKAFGTLSFYAKDADAFSVQEVESLAKLAEELSFGIHAIRDHLSNETAIIKLQDNLTKTVGAIATAMEMRDAYTSGHQRNVAELSCAIGRQLALAATRIEGLLLAGQIHDVGKIAVPSEYLSKPGRLSALEFQIIQTHVQTGHDIIQGIDFPWPIADMVLQHHECLDGSGYPNGLKGDQILLESRILAVADVVDAMMAHRPYRPALSPEVAFAELEAGRGTRYDAHVVDACLTLFREKGFQFGTGSHPPAVRTAAPGSLP